MVTDCEIGGGWMHSGYPSECMQSGCQKLPEGALACMLLLQAPHGPAFGVSCSDWPCLPFLLAHALHMLHKHFDCNTELKTLNQPAAMAYVEAAASLITVAYGQESNWGMLHEIGHNHQINEMTPPSTGEVGGKGCSKGRRAQQREGEMWEAREGRKHERNTVQLCVAHGRRQQHGPSFSASNNLARLVSNASEWNAVQLDSNETRLQTPQVTCNFWSLYGMEKVERVDRTTRYTNRRAETLAYWADTTCRYPACFSPEVGIYM